MRLATFLSNLIYNKDRDGIYVGDPAFARYGSKPRTDQSNWMEGKPTKGWSCPDSTKDGWRLSGSGTPGRKTLSFSFYY